jgi:hypothetical protein
MEQSFATNRFLPFSAMAVSILNCGSSSGTAGGPVGAIGFIGRGGVVDSGRIRRGHRRRGQTWAQQTGPH